MDRRTFVEKMTAASIGGAIALRSEWLQAAVMPRPAHVASVAPGVPPPALAARFQELLRWMAAQGWGDLLHTVTGQAFDPELPLDHWTAPVMLTAEAKGRPGFDDFGGAAWATPGDPALSLLYHVLASPHVLLPDTYDRAENYPTLEHLDLLEDYIYALSPHTAATVGGAAPGERYVVAVMAYEYRTAHRTPHGAHADLVFSRTGLARVGQEPMHYDRRARSCTSVPADRTRSRYFAVTPARYAAFLAKAVGMDDLALRTPETHHAGDKERTFLLPVRKLFDGDPLLGGGTLRFAEHHRNEKLNGLFCYLQNEHGIGPMGHDIERAPFVRNSHTDDKGPLAGHDSTMVHLQRTGSSALLAGTPAPLVAEALQDGKRICFQVPEQWARLGKTNRRYRTFKLMRRKSKDVWGAVRATVKELIPGAQVTDLREPRNAPMFANIRYRMQGPTSVPEHIGHDTPDFPEVLDGSYLAAAFEDGLCHGCVSVELMPTERVPADAQNAPAWHVLPAVSLVTAPDLFPWSDLHDLVCAFPGKGDDFLFEGGTEDISGIRLRGAPNIHLPGRPDTPAFPITAADPVEFAAWNTLAAVVARHAPDATGERRVTGHGQSFLPDTASNVFYPGWDATYGGDRHIKFLTTTGLGSPFLEDMKLCAAANGMWPVSSPDAARTFQGRLEKIPLYGYPTTSVPLLDDELGYHGRSPAVLDHGVPQRAGWDGAYGPFLGRKGTTFVVDFADIVATDYVRNALEDRIDASILRAIPTQELIARMDALRLATQALGYRKVKKAKLWLVGAERADDLGTAPWHGHLLPASWAVRADLLRPAQHLEARGAGYLFLFVDRPTEHVPKERNKDRLCLERRCIYVVQIAGDRVAWTKLFPKDVDKPLARPWQ